MYIHELKNWTDFRWSAEAIALPLDEVCREQGKLAGRLSGLGFDSQLRAVAENLTRDVVYSLEIEGIRLNVDEVRRLKVSGFLWLRRFFVESRHCSIVQKNRQSRIVPRKS